MKYVGLLRGVNVGGNHKVSMGELKNTFERLGFSHVTTYLNSGNIIFETDKTVDEQVISAIVNTKFGFTIPMLIKSTEEMHSIVAHIPEDWENNGEFKCDVAYLFPEIDSKETIETLPIVKQYIDIRYTKGAVFWRVNRNDYNNSHLNKLISHKYYRLMTVRNINTARFLGQ